MKKHLAIVLAVVMVFTCVAATACNKNTVSIILMETENGSPKVVNHVTGEDDLPVPVNGSLTFGGWYYDKACNQPFKTSDTVADGTILYAKWTSAQATTVTLTLNPNYTGAKTTVIELAKNATFNLPNVTRTGYTFAGWFTQPVDGIQWTNAMPFAVDTTLYAHWTDDNHGGNDDVPPHTHNFGQDNYFIYVKCSVEGCNEMGRTESTNPFRNDFEYSYTQADKTAMDSAYTTLVGQINGGSVDVKVISDGIEDFELLLPNIEYQYQVATVMFSINYDDAWEQKATLIGSAYNDWFKDFYTLFGLIDKSSYSAAYFADWPTEDKEYVLEQAEIYSASEDNLQTIADNLATEYNNLFNNLESEADIPQLYEAYGKYVEANNNIAKQYGNKYANFMDYSYANEYGREYTPADVAQMRNYVKTVIAPVLIKLSNLLDNAKGFYDDNENFYAGMEDDYQLYESLVFDSLFTLDEGYEQGTYDATNYIGNYFKYLNNNKTGSKEIDFYKQVNLLFKNGNYFTATNGEEGAYTYFIENLKTPIMYFDDTYDYYYGYSYSTAFTFVHEFGHYYADIYTNGGDFSMDHAETHSQGNEMLFLAWLNQNCPKGAEYGYKLLQAEQLFGILQTIVQSTVVDEFEQAVYSGTYGDGTYKNGIQPSQYGDLYSEILSTYGSEMTEILGTEYWLYVVVDSSAYYISYAMSALPSLELFVKAMSDGVDAAREIYFKLFTFADENNGATYAEALAYAGLDSPFSESMYTTVSNYFKNYTL